MCTRFRKWLCLCMTTVIQNTNYTNTPTLCCWMLAGSKHWALKHWQCLPQLWLLCSLPLSARSAPPLCCSLKQSPFSSAFKNLEECRETTGLSRPIMPNEAVRSLRSNNNCCVELCVCHLQPLWTPCCLSVQCHTSQRQPLDNTTPMYRGKKQNITAFMKDNLFQVCCTQMSHLFPCSAFRMQHSNPLRLNFVLLHRWLLLPLWGTFNNLNPFTQLEFS